MLLFHHVQHFATPWTAACKVFLPPQSPIVCSNSCPFSQWCHPTISSCHPLLLLPSIFPSIRSCPIIQLFALGSEVLEFQLQCQSFSEYSGLIFLRIDWLDLLAVPGTLKSLLQHHHLKASVIHHSALFMVQLSHACTATGKTIALTIRTFFKEK